MQKEQYPKIAYKFKLHYSINVFITIAMIEEKMGLEAMRCFIIFLSFLIERLYDAQ